MAAFGKYTHPKLRRALARRRQEGMARGVVPGGDRHLTGGGQPAPTEQLDPNRDESRRPGKG